MKALLNPWVLLGALVVLLASNTTSYLYGGKHEAGRAAREELKLVAVEERAAKGAATEISKLKIIHRTNTQVLEREFVNNPLPDTCRLSDDGLRILNSIIEGKPAAASGSELPEADPAP